MGESVILLSDSAMVVAYIKKQRHCFSLDAQSGTGGTHLVRAVRSLPHRRVHSGKEDCSYLPAQSSRSGAFYQVVFSSLGVRVSLVAAL